MEELETAKTEQKASNPWCLQSSKYKRQQIEIKVVVVNKREEFGILVSMVGCGLNTSQLVVDLGIL